MHKQLHLSRSQSPSTFLPPKMGIILQLLELLGALGTIITVNYILDLLST